MRDLERILRNCFEELTEGGFGLYDCGSKCEECFGMF
jgi:hypothetical protein